MRIIKERSLTAWFYAIVLCVEQLSYYMNIPSRGYIIVPLFVVCSSLFFFYHVWCLEIWAPFSSSIWMSSLSSSCFYSRLLCFRDQNKTFQETGTWIFQINALAVFFPDPSTTLNYSSICVFLGGTISTTYKRILLLYSIWVKTTFI